MARTTTNASTTATASEDIWFPYSQRTLDPEPIQIHRASGALLYDDEGSIIDAISSWWVTLHGHGHPHIIGRVQSQLDTLDHVMLSGFTHEPATILAQRLLAMASHPFSRVFYSDNGSTSVETALKIALQYWHNLGRPRSRIVAFRGAHHGETFGCMATSERSRFVRPFESFLFEVEFIEPPTPGREEASLEQMRACLEGGPVAAFIYEPCLQGVAGMVPHDPKVLSELLSECRSHGVVTIADEVLTGLGRTGPIFASDAVSTPPDLLCLAKGLTGGVLPLGATLCAEHLHAAFCNEDRSQALLHGHAYCGNPVGCAAANATLDLLLTDQCDHQREWIETEHRKFQAQHLGDARLRRCDVIGTILALEYATEGSYFAPLRDRLLRCFYERRVLLRPFGNTVHVVPPYCITSDQLCEIYSAITDSLELVL